MVHENNIEYWEEEQKRQFRIITAVTHSFFKGCTCLVELVADEREEALRVIDHICADKSNISVDDAIPYIKKELLQCCGDDESLKSVLKLLM